MTYLLPVISLVSRAILNSTIRQIRPTNHLRSFIDITTIQRRHMSNEHVSVTFIGADGKKTTVKASQNKSLYDAVIDNDVDIDGFGACEGTLCCTTCHLIFKETDYEKVGKPSDEELDMLDLAYGLTDTSRLGCQVFLKKELDPLEVYVPASINDVRES